MPRVARVRTRPLPRAERREAILQAATRAFAGAGYAATSMDTVAAEARVTKLIVYRHFASKEELYRAALDRVRARVTAALPAGESATANIGTTWLGSLLGAARADPAGFELLWRHSSREREFADYADEVRAHAVGVLLAEMCRVPAELREWAAYAAFGYVLQSVLHWLELGDIRRDREFLYAAGEALRAGVRAWSTVAGGIPP